MLIIQGKGVILMPLTEARSRANKKWDAENLERIHVVVRAGEKEQIRAAADAAGESLNHYIIAAVKERMQRESQEAWEQEYHEPDPFVYSGGDPEEARAAADRAAAAYMKDYGPSQEPVWKRGLPGTRLALAVGAITEADIED